VYCSLGRLRVVTESTELELRIHGQLETTTALTPWKAWKRELVVEATETSWRGRELRGALWRRLYNGVSARPSVVGVLLDGFPFVWTRLNFGDAARGARLDAGPEPVGLAITAISIDAPALSTLLFAPDVVYSTLIEKATGASCDDRAIPAYTAALRPRPPQRRTRTSRHSDRTLARPPGISRSGTTVDAAVEIEGVDVDGAAAAGAGDTGPTGPSTPSRAGP
jgi:hypothetical protein